MAKANFNLSQFISQSRRDSFARVNRFEVFILPPLALSRNRDAISVSLYCEMASLPPVNISTKSFKIFGPTYQRPFGAEYGGEGISLTFHVDRDMQVKKFFDEWTAKVVDPDTGLVGYQEEYTTTIRLRQLDEQDTVTYGIELTEAFPRSVNLLELNNSAQNQTHRLNVLFAYRYWKDTDREFETTPTDIPRQLLNPSIPVVDTRLTDVQANAARTSFARTDPRRVDLG
jgi:hypothetical protein